jgi:hypothetical protein
MAHRPGTGYPTTPAVSIQALWRRLTQHVTPRELIVSSLVGLCGLTVLWAHRRRTLYERHLLQGNGTIPTPGKTKQVKRSTLNRIRRSGASRDIPYESSCLHTHACRLSQSLLLYSYSFTG